MYNNRRRPNQVLARLLKNHLTGEIWYCENYNHSKYIDGIEFITVCKEPGQRTFLMAKDSLRPYSDSSL